MSIAIYGDVHLTKKMGTLQSMWDTSSVKVFTDMYKEFNERNLSFAVCLGDFFDAPRLEARSVKLVTKILSIINNSSFPTYFLLGNHEIFDEDSNILDFLSEYENINPVTDLKVLDNMLFVPYSVSLEELPESIIEGKYLFTHHDIYGSKLAGGKVRANFGVNPEVLSRAEKVFNGHVHLDSSFNNIINVGSLLKSQQGELRLGEYPLIYFLDTEENIIRSTSLLEDFIAPLTINQEEYDDIFNDYRESVNFILRIEYKDELKLSIDSLDKNTRILKYRLHRDIREETLDSSDIRKTSINLEEMIVNYIRKDVTIEDKNKERLVSLSMELLGAQV